MTGFDRKSAERIAKVVGYVEGVIQNRPPVRGAGAVFPPYGFWARISDTDGSAKYSWKAQKIGSDGTLTDDSDGASGNYSDETGYAVEALWHSVAVIVDEKVWMQPALSQDFLVFAYCPGVYKWTLTNTIGGQSGGSQTVGSQTISLSNPYSSSIASGTIVTVGYEQGSWTIIGADCLP